MLKFGTIKEYYPSTGMVSVFFEADDIVTDPMPVIFTKTKSDKDLYPFDNGEQVACLMDEHCEHGVCLGATYSDDIKPDPSFNKDVFGIKFNNGDKMIYDRNLKSLTYEIGGNASLNMQADTFDFRAGNMRITGNNTTGKFDFSNGGDSLKAILSDLIDAIDAITVTAPSGGGPTSTPLNSATFTGIATRVTNFLN